MGNFQKVVKSWESSGTESNCSVLLLPIQPILATHRMTQSMQIHETKPYSKGKYSIKVLGCVKLDLTEIQTFYYRL